MEDLMTQWEEYEQTVAAEENYTLDIKRPSDRQIGGDHYKDMRIQPTTFITQNKLNWCEGNAVKYICRHRIKGSEKDILKAIHYLELLLEQEYAYVRPKDTVA